MNRFRLIAMMSFVSLVALAVSPAVKADEHDKKTTVTFSVPVEIPGVESGFTAWYVCL